MSNTDTAIRGVVDSFVDQLQRIIHQAALESVQTALNAGDQSLRQGAAPAKTRLPGPAQSAPGTVAKRSPQELDELVRNLQAHIVKNPGQRIESIAASLGVRTKELVLPVRKLLNDKKISTKGQKRATLYFSR